MSTCEDCSGTEPEYGLPGVKGEPGHRFRLRWCGACALHHPGAAAAGQPAVGASGRGLTAQGYRNLLDRLGQVTDVN